MPAFSPGYLHDWNKTVPSGSSTIQQGDDLLRSDKSILEGVLNAEHYFTNDSASSRSGGEHRPGSARIFVGNASSISVPQNPQLGRVFYASNATDLWIATSDSSYSLIGLGTIGKRNTWAVDQSFSDSISVRNNILIGDASFVTLHSPAVDILQTDDAFWASSISASEVSTSVLTTESLFGVAELSLNSLKVGSGGSTIKGILYGRGWMPAVAIGPGTSEVTFITVPGAAIGDVAFANFDVSTDNEVLITVQTTDANQAKVIMANIASAGTATLASDLTIHVICFDIT